MSRSQVRRASVLLLVALSAASTGAQIPVANADVNGDCTVTIADVNIVKANLGLKHPNLRNPLADLNGDRVVNNTDLNFVLRNVGKVVCSLNRPPIAAAGPDVRAAVAQTVTLNGSSSSDPDSDPLSYRWELLAKPAGSGAQLTGATTASPSFVPDRPGDYDVRLTVQDGRGGSAADDLRVLVDVVNRAPVITTSPVLAAQSGRLYTYDVNATDPDNDALSYALVFAPPGMAIDPSTGAITWTPTPQQAGIRGAQVEVSDGRGGTAYQGLAIEVLAPVNQPPVAAADRYEVGFGQTLAVASAGVLANDSDPEAQPLTAQLVSSPGEGTLDLRPDGSFTYVPRALAAPGALKPTVEWTQSAFRVGRTSTQIMMTPIVIDANRDGVPEIYVATHSGSGWTSVGHLRALAGGPTPLTNFNLVGLKNTTIQVSSTFTAYAPERAIDGDLQTSWFTARPDPAAFLQVTFPSAVTVRELRMFGNRQFASGHDFLSGRFELFDGAGALLYSSGVVVLPAPDRDLKLVLPAPLAGVKRARFTATGYQTPGDDHGFAELEIIGDAMADPGTELWTVSGQVHGSSGIAAGDIDLDGFAEIVAQDAKGGLIAFEHDGTFKWRSVPLGFDGNTVASPSIADMDNDGVPEIIAGAAVVNSDGTLRWKGPNSADTGNNGFGPISVVVDLDLDGRPELVTGRSAFRADGSIYWTSTRREGFTGIGNFDLDPFPEIVVVDRAGVRLHEHDGTLKWGPKAIPEGGRGGPPTVADVDADGYPEIGVAGDERYVVFETDGSIKWAIEIQDFSSNVTGSSVFDFEGDGSAEIVYGDELFLRILRGSDGAELFKMEKGSSTLHELPTIADVDGDGRAEIIVGANDAEYGRQTGLYVIGGADGNWIPTRAIWNQHAYHVTNVRADGTIPATEPHHWLVPGLNMFRQNAFAPGDPDRATSFTYRVSDGSLPSNDAVVHITLRQPNSPPVIQTLPVAAAASGIEYLYGPAISDPDLGDTHTFELLMRPAGMTIDALSGLLRWTPANTQRGDHPVTLRVVDHRGLFDLQAFTINVSSPIAVPAVTGHPQAVAEGSTRAAGLSVGLITTAYSTSVPLGHVIAQTPLPGMLVAPTTAVHLQVSAGLEPVTVPNLLGLTESAARAALASRGLVVGSITLASSNTAAPDTVMTQSPAAGVVASVTSAVNVTVSTGAAIAVAVQRSLIEAGGSTAFVAEAYDHTGAPLTPPPPITFAITAAPGESAGTAPRVVGNVITTSANTRGVYTLRATLQSSGDTASATFVVSRPGAAGPAQYAALNDAIATLAQDAAALETAILSGDLAAIPALRNALAATRDGIPLDKLAGSTAFAPEGGFPPTLAALSAAGFPETAADIAWNTALRNVIAVIEQTETFLARLTQAGLQNDDLKLQQLNADLETSVNALLAIKPTIHGIVKRANVVNHLVSIRIPRLLHAQVDVIVRTLAEQGLARSVDPLEQFYGLLAAASRDALDPAAYYATRQPTIFTLTSLMSATRIRSTIIQDVYMPIIGELVRGGLILAGNGLLKAYTNAGSLVGVITASSLSFHFFDIPGSVIEGFGFDRDFPEGNEVLIVGPGTINEVVDLFSGIEPFEDLQASVEFFDAVRAKAQALGDKYFKPENRHPSSVARGCIFEFHPACNELVYDQGFYSVHETDAGSFPAPVLFIVRNVVTGSWGTVVANFFPTKPD